MQLYSLPNRNQAYDLAFNDDASLSLHSIIFLYGVKSRISISISVAVNRAAGFLTGGIAGAEKMNNKTATCGSEGRRLDKDGLSRLRGRLNI